MPIFAHVQSGQRLRIPAATWNAVVDVAAAAQKAGPLGGRVPALGAIGVLCANGTNAARARFDVMGIAGPLVGRAENEGEFLGAVRILGTDVGAVDSHRFVVLQEPLAVGAIGVAAIAGPTLCRVYMENEADTCAELDITDGTRLRSTAAGSASLLWVEPIGERESAHLAWAIVNLGGGSGGGSGVAYLRVSARNLDWTLDGHLLRVPAGGGDPETYGDVLNVQCTTFGVDGLAWGDVVPSIAVGNDVPVVYAIGAWHCLFPIIGTEACP